MMDGSSLSIEIRQATAGDISDLANVLARAFADGPITRWHVPDVERRVDTMTRFFAAGLEHVFLPHGEVFTTAGGITGCYIWIPPGTGSVRDDGTASFDEACEHIFRDFPRTFELFTIMDEIHPAEPRYYLPFVGVDPTTQRRGVGRALLAPVLAKCDREGPTLAITWRMSHASPSVSPVSLSCMFLALLSHASQQIAGVDPISLVISLEQTSRGRPLQLGVLEWLAVNGPAPPVRRGFSATLLMRIPRGRARSWHTRAK